MLQRGHLLFRMYPALLPGDPESPLTGAPIGCQKECPFPSSRSPEQKGSPTSTRPLNPPLGDHLCRSVTFPSQSLCKPH